MIMKEKLTSGIAWVMFATLASKMLTVVAQVVLGYYLAIEDFGIYATALGMTAVFSWMKNGSILQLIIREAVAGGSTGKFFKFANGFNVVSSFGLFGLAYLYWDDANYIGFLMLSFAIAQLFSLPQLKIRSSCSASGRFKALGYYELGQSLLNNLTVVFFAILLGDERCFAFSILAITLYDIVIHSFYFKSKISKERFDFNAFRQVWLNGKWLLLGAIGSSMAMQGVFLVIGLWETDITLGLYFFAFQLVSVFAVIVGEAVRKVLMPVLSSIENEDDRFGSLNRVLKYCSLFVIPISFGSVIGIGPAMDVIWSGKWAGAIVAAELMTATLFMPILVLLCYSYYEASGFWRLRNVVQVLDGVFLLIAVGVGSVLGGLTLIAICAVLRRLFFCLFLLHYTYKKGSKKLEVELFQHLLGVGIVSFATVLVAVSCLDFFDAGNAIRIFTSIFVIAISIFILLAWKYPHDLQELVKRLKVN